MRRRLAQEDGFTVVVAMFVVLVGLLFATAAIGQAMSTESSVRGDGQSKQALQAARAGLETAVARLTAVSEGLAKNSPAAACPRKVASALFLDGAQTSRGGVPWCSASPSAPTFSDQVGSDESVDTYVSGDLEPTRWLTDSRAIVSTGIAGDGRRRVKTTWVSLDIRQLFRDYTVFSDQDLYLNNQADVGSPTIRGNAGSNGSIHLGNPGNVIYGDATPGPGGIVDNRGTVQGSTTPATQPLNLPPVDPIPLDMNDNAQICSAGCPAGVSFDNLDLQISGDDVTIRGNTFVVCSLSMTGQGNPKITFQPDDVTKPVRIFIKDQADCASPRPANVLDIGQKPLVSVASTTYPSLQIFVAGDPSRPTNIAIANNNPTLPITLYAPASNVSIANNGTLSGGIAARSVTMTNSTQIVFPSNGGSLDIEIPPKITPGEFVECTAQVGATQTLTDGC